MNVYRAIRLNFNFRTMRYIILGLSSLTWFHFGRISFDSHRIIAPSIHGRSAERRGAILNTLKKINIVVCFMIL